MSDDDKGKILHFPTFLRFELTAEDHQRELASIFERMNLRAYRLVGHTPVRIKTTDDFGRVFEQRSREIAECGIDPWRVDFTDFGGGLTVSTVFLSLDHSRDGGEPMLFETMVFDSERGGDLVRCSTWDEAEAQHARIVAELGKLRVVK
jgi:hypothetical protein